MAKECNNSGCDKSSCEGCPSRTGAAKNEFLEPVNAKSKIGRVIAVASGKGGVGKSLVTASLANQMVKLGYRVGIMDADITGPSIPRMYGLTGSAVGDGENILPRETANGIKVISVNLLLPTQETPVIWRGPIVANMVKQFWTDVIWGELDYLFVDMPPGTGDVPLTAFQSLPIDGVFIVTSPQDLVRMIVTKAFHMAEMMHIPVLGIVENYSYVRCPDCGKAIMVFGQSHIDDIAADLAIPVVGRIPIDPELAAMVEEGRFAEVENTYLEQAKAVMPACESL